LGAMLKLSGKVEKVKPRKRYRNVKVRPLGFGVRYVGFFIPLL